MTVTIFLESLPWSRPALNLINHVKNLNPNKPAILHIRHTERTSFTKEEVDGTGDISGYNLYSTDLGKEAAYHFGASLPTSREYKIFHTSIDRTLETVESIRRGIESNGGVASIAGRMAEMPILRSEGEKRAEQEAITEIWSEMLFPMGEP